MKLSDSDNRAGQNDRLGDSTGIYGIIYDQHFYFRYINQLEQNQAQYVAQVNDLKEVR